MIGRWAALFLGYATVALAVYAPALGGGFVSDDIGYVSGNPWIHELSLANLAAILAPTGPAAAHTANYAPVHLLLHAVAWQLFGPATTGHHVLNVLVHALATTLCAALFVRAGFTLLGAAVGGALLLLHPANVEAVAWIFQLKTVVALALACTALLLEPRRPGLAAAVFGLALLAKIQAAFALPVAAIWVWLDHPDGARARGARLLWLGVWALLLGFAFAPEYLAFERLGHAEMSAASAGGAERARSMAALMGRYLAMAATSWGVSAFHQPDPPGGWLDPWCLLGLAGAAAMAARAAVVCLRRDPEAAWWAWVAGGFLPVSQLLPFLYPMADRYLYYALPGLVGALGLAARRAPVPRAVRAAGFAAVIAGVAAFAVHSVERAAVWQSDLTLARDSAAHYPDGLPAQRLRAVDAARQGDVDAAVTALRAAKARGFDRFIDLQRDPSFDPIRQDPRFAAVLSEIAGQWLAHVERREGLTVQEQVMVGHARAARGDWDAAVASLEQAARAGGPGSDQAKAALAELRVARIRAEREAARRSPPGVAPPP